MFFVFENRQISQITKNEPYARSRISILEYNGKARLYGLFSLGVWRCLKYVNLYSPRFFMRLSEILASGGGCKITKFR